MSSTCFHPGPVNTWSLPTNQTGRPHAFFPAKAGCCNLVTETSLPTGTLHLLFQQMDPKNQTLNSYTRDLTTPKNYTGLVGSQVDLSVTKATLLNLGPIKGTQQYINCSDAQNLVGDDHESSHTAERIIGFFSGIGLMICLISVAAHFHPNKEKNGYTGLSDVHPITS